jgi:hypothetical protein
MPKRSEKEVRKEQADDIRAVMGSVGGRRFVLRVMEDVCGINMNPMRMPPDAAEVRPEERLPYNVAKLNVGRWLREEAKAAAPDEFRVMYIEAENAELAEQVQRQQKSKPALEDEEEQTNG